MDKRLFRPFISSLMLLYQKIEEKLIPERKNSKIRPWTTRFRHVCEADEGREWCVSIQMFIANLLYDLRRDNAPRVPTFNFLKNFAENYLAKFELILTQKWSTLHESMRVVAMLRIL